MAVNRRTLLRAGLTATVASGLIKPGLAVAAVTQPPIYDTRNWHARDPNGTIQVLNQRPTFIVVHHTAMDNSNDFSLEHAFQISRDIQDLHMDSNGWIDTGQQLTNSRGGFVTEGRHRSLEVLTGGTRHVMGAHVANNNSTCIGIENEGLYMTVDVPNALWNSLVKLVAYIAQQYQIPTSRIKGHRDFNSTLCPGDVLYARLPELRTAVGRLLGTGATAAEETGWPLLRTGSTGPEVLAAQHLLRAQGLQVPVDGVFDERTFGAVQRFAALARVPYEPCYGCRFVDESGYLGASTWPLLVSPVRATAPGDVGGAARILLAAKGSRVSGDAVVDLPTWRTLLN
jgi:N-acetylmuramoyl-L-alanine amidase-like protein